MGLSVLHVFKTYFPDTSGGVEQVIREIAVGTRADGVATTVLTLSANRESHPLDFEGHHVERVPRRFDVASTGFSPALFARFRALAPHFDVVHYHFPWPMMDLLHLSLSRRPKSVVTYHSDIVRQRRLERIYAPLRRRFLASVDAVVATSSVYAETSPVLAALARPARIIPIGIADSPAADPARVEAFRARFGARFFLFVGVLRYYKGLPYLIEAARRTGLPVVVAGSGEGDALFDAANLPNIHRLGHVSEADKAALLALCTGFVFPSHLRSEAFGVALLEAARAGKPMISCEIGTGTSYINRNGATGLVIPPADPSALADAMRHIWQDGAAAQRMGAAARSRYEAEFTAERMAARYAALYREVTRIRN